ncbi:MAG TPA: extracellular solute-binding protein [Pseudonocardiaceae bacterium]|jgi:ABC-type glycerol-3-phosphate transport system substrate-binding protein|nr:extracellular solute-binding protein [Pseudonocardiaceae bacterium]
MEAMSGGSLKGSLAHLTADFEQANPDISVNLEESPDYSTLEKNEKDAITAKKAPTIGQVYEGWAADYARSGVIDPLDGFTGTNPAAVSDLYAGVRDDLKLCDGETWMWPFNKSVYVNFANQEMLKAAGRTTPSTWDQYATAAKAASKNGVVGITIDPGGKDSLTTGTIWFEILAEAYGTPVFDRNGVPQFNSPAAVKAMRYLADLKQAGALAVGKNYPGETALGAQKGLFDISSVAGYSYEKQAVGGRFTLGTSDLPAGLAKQANQMNGTNLVLFDQATPAQKAAAWKFMQFLTTAASQAYWATATGYLPVVPAALSRMSAFVAQNPWMNTAAQALRHSSGTAPVPWADDTQGELAVALTDVLTSGTSPKDALDKAQQDAMSDMKAQQ